MSDVPERALERLRRQREEALATAEQRLSAAEEKIRGLGRLCHRRERRELQVDSARHLAAVRLARKQLASMPLEPPGRLARTRRLSLERATPALGRVNELDRGRGLEL